MIPDGELLLYGIVRRLNARNLKLGVPEYLDAVRALRLEISEPALHRPPDREALRRLCQILWARGAEETRLIDAVFASIPPPAAEHLDAFTSLVEGPPEDQQITARDATPAVESGAAIPGQSVRIDIATPHEAGGVPLPYPVLPPSGTETFVMEPQTFVPARMLAVLWRRYRRMARVGRRTELDLDATIDERGRTGTIDRPVLRAPKINRARLIVLADVSPSMAAWRPFMATLERSLRLSRLQHARLLYFSNLPKRVLFESAGLSGATSSDRILEAFRGASLLIVSDAGAARGYRRRQRATQTRAFLDLANRHMRAIVWVNPMPKSRWAGTTAEGIAETRCATFLPLDVASLIRAVDILRGTKSH